MIYCIRDDGDDTGSSAILHDGLDKLVPECLYSGFIGANDDDSGGDNCSNKPQSDRHHQNTNTLFLQALPICHPTVSNSITPMRVKKQHYIKMQCRHRQHVSDVEIATPGIQQTFTIKIV